MERKRAPLRLNCSVRFQDRWQGRLSAVEIDPEGEVLNVTVTRGSILRSTSARLPFSAVSEWSDTMLAFNCTSDEAFGRQIPPVAAPTRSLSPSVPVSAPGARLVGLLVERTSRRATHFLIARGVVGQSRLVPREQVSLEGDVIRLAAPLDQMPVYRSDDELVERVRQALVALPYLTGDDRRGLQVEAVDGVIVLRGNVRTPHAKMWAAQAARSVDGALEVRDEVIDDPHLEIDVGFALERAGLFHDARVYVRANAGEVTLYGFVPSPAYAEEVVRVASRVPGVRAVVSRMEVEPPAQAAPPPEAPAPAQG